MIIAFVKLIFIKCNQLFLASIQIIMKNFLFKSFKLNILICNIDVMIIKIILFKNDYENQFNINYVVYAFLLKLLLFILQKTVNNSINKTCILFFIFLDFLYSFSDNVQFNDLKTTQNLDSSSQLACYNQSKLINMQYFIEFAYYYSFIIFVSLHLNIINTNIIKRLKLNKKNLINQINKIIMKLKEKIYNMC